MDIKREYTPQFIQKVKDSLQNANDNDYQFSGWTPRQIAEDLMEYVIGFEHEDVEGLSELIEKIQGGDI